MKNKIQQPGRKTSQRDHVKEDPVKREADPEGYPEYPPNEDIYIQYIEEPELNPEEPDTPKDFTPDSGEPQTGVFSGGDLDVPGSELDDEMENIGEEDEENNYYSLGGENHEDLEESSDEP